MRCTWAVQVGALYLKEILPYSRFDTMSMNNRVYSSLYQAVLSSFCCYGPHFPESPAFVIPGYNRCIILAVAG